VLHVTDGAPRDFADWRVYAERRKREATAALAVLGRESLRIQCLGIPDPEVIFKIVDLTQELTDLLTNYDFVVTHAYEGGHPDHDATALGVHAACRRIQESGGEPPSIFEMTGYHGLGSEDYVRGVFVPHPDAGAVAELILTPAERHLKSRMFACHASQRAVLKMFSLEVEKFRAAPHYDFLTPPHGDRLLYDGPQWHDAAEQGLSRLGLLDRM
jgi:LmbE family N-acetylglucosaminyl deacetylase